MCFLVQVLTIANPLSNVIFNDRWPQTDDYSFLLMKIDLATVPPE